MKQIIITTAIFATFAAVASGFDGTPRGDRRPGPPPPDKMAARIISDFDDDASLGVDTVELADALAFLHENRPPPPVEVEQAPEPPETRTPDHNRLAARLLEKFDHDQDGQLNSDELGEAFADLHERRGQQRPPHRRD